MKESFTRIAMFLLTLFLFCSTASAQTHTYHESFSVHEIEYEGFSGSQYAYGSETHFIDGDITGYVNWKTEKLYGTPDNAYARFGLQNVDTGTKYVLSSKQNVWGTWNTSFSRNGLPAGNYRQYLYVYAYEYGDDCKGIKATLLNDTMIVDTVPEGEIFIQDMTTVEIQKIELSTPIEITLSSSHDSPVNVSTYLKIDNSLVDTQKCQIPTNALYTEEIVIPPFMIEGDYSIEIEVKDENNNLSLMRNFTLTAYDPIVSGSTGPANTAGLHIANGNGFNFVTSYQRGRWHVGSGQDSWRILAGETIEDGPDSLTYYKTEYFENIPVDCNDGVVRFKFYSYPSYAFFSSDNDYYSYDFNENVETISGYINWSKQHFIDDGDNYGLKGELYVSSYTIGNGTNNEDTYIASLGNMNFVKPYQKGWWRVNNGGSYNTLAYENVSLWGDIFRYEGTDYFDDVPVANNNGTVTFQFKSYPDFANLRYDYKNVSYDFGADVSAISGYVKWYGMGWDDDDGDNYAIKGNLYVSSYTTHKGENISIQNMKIVTEQEINRSTPIEITLLSTYNNPANASTYLKIDDTTIGTARTCQVSANGNYTESIVIPPFTTEGEHLIEIQVIDEKKNLSMNRSFILEIWDPDKLKTVEQCGDALQDEAIGEIGEMAGKVAEIGYTSLAQIPSSAWAVHTKFKPGMKDLVSDSIGEGVTEIQKDAATTLVIEKPMFLLGKISDWIAELKVKPTIINLAKTSLMSGVWDERQKINDRSSDFTDFIRLVEVSNLRNKQINEITIIGTKALQKVSSSRNNIISGANLDSSLDYIITGLTLQVSGPAALFIDFSIDDYYGTIDFIDTFKSIFDVVLFALVLLVCIVILLAAALPSGGISLTFLGSLLANLDKFSFISDIGVSAMFIMATFMSTMIFQCVAVPEVVDLHDGVLDIIEVYIDEDLISEAHVSQMLVMSSDSYSANIETSLDTLSSESVIHIVYSPDGQISGFGMDDGAAVRTSSTVTVPLSAYGEYTIASATFSDLEENTVQTTNVSNNPIPIDCVVYMDKRVYSENESITLNAEFTNGGSTDLDDVPYYLGLTNMVFNETGTIDIPSNSSTLKIFTFSAPENGSYSATAIMFSGLIPACQAETSFVVGNGTSVSLTADIPDLFEPGVLPVTNLTLQCAGHEFAGTIVVRTSSVSDELPLYMNTVDYSMNANSTANIQVNILDSSNPGTYITQISYGDSSTIRKFVVQADNTILLIPDTNKMLYDLNETITVNVTSKNQSLNPTSFNFELEHVYPNGTIETILKNETSTGKYVGTLIADVNGTHYLKTKGESDTMRIYAEDTFFIVNKRSNPCVSNTYYSNETDIIVFEISNDDGEPIEEASVMFNNTSFFTDNMGYVSFVEEETTNLTLEIKKPGYASYYGVYQLLNPIEDAELPSVEISSIQEGAVYDDSVLYLSGNLTDNIRVQDACYTINNASTSTLDFDENGSFTLLVESSKLIYGLNNISVTVFDMCGNENESIVNFTMEEPLNLFISSPINGSTYSEFPEIDITTSKEASLTYSLNDNNDTVTMLAQYAIEGQNNLTVYATDTAGSTAVESVLFYYEPVVPSVSFIANVTSGNIPLSVRFVDTSTNSPSNWSWNFGDGAMSTEQNPVHVYTDVGNFTVSLTTTNATGNASLVMDEYVRVVNESSGSGEPVENSTLAGFDNFKTISISPSSDGTLTDYQMSFNIDYESEMQSDFDDLRFTDEDGILLPYWIEEKTNSSSAKVWVKIPVIDGTNDTVIKMHYGNSTVSSAENGDDVFEFFDDFDDLSQWTQYGSTSLSPSENTVSNGILTTAMQRGVGEVRQLRTESPLATTDDFVIHTRLYTMTESAYGETRLQIWPKEPATITEPGGKIAVDAGADKLCIAYPSVYSSYSIDGDKWYKCSISYSNENGTVRLYDDNDNTLLSSKEGTIVDNGDYLSLTGTHSYGKYDYLFVTKYAESEPAYSMAISNSAFTNNKTINIHPSSDGTLTNYQMSFNIDYEDKMQPDFDDIRFTDEDGIILPYWIESMTNSSEAKVWVKIPVIDGTNDTVIKMHYGNPTVSSAENGDDVFEFFDDFNDLSKWCQYGSTSLSPSENTVSNGILTTAMQRGVGEVRQLRTESPLAITDDFVIHTRLYTMTESAYGETRLQIWPKEPATITEPGGKIAVDAGADKLCIVYPSVYSSYSIDSDTWYKCSISYSSENGTVRLYDDSSNTLLSSKEGTIVDSGDYLSLTGTHSYGKYDYLFVTKYAESEPAYSMTISNSAFTNNESINIHPSSDGTLTNYQMSFDIDYEAEMQADFDDIRFTDEDGILLPYWIESMTNSSEAKVWVKIPVIDGTNDTVIKMHYGNPTVSSAENGDDVFEFFDDFSGNLSKWMTQGSTWAIVDEKLRLYSTTYSWRYAYANALFSKPYVIEVDAVTDRGDAKLDPGILIGYNGTPSSTMGIIDYNGGRLMATDGTNIDSTGELTGSTGTIKVTVAEDGTISGYKSDGSLNKVFADKSVLDNRYVGVAAFYDGTIEWDNFRVRQYIENEPTYTITEGTIVPYWIEGTDNGDRTFVKVDRLEPLQTQIYTVEKVVGYEPSIDDVMEFGDDFDNQTSLDTSKWTSQGTISVSNGECSLGGDDAIYAKTSFGYGYITEANAKADEQDSLLLAMYDSATPNNRIEIGNSDGIVNNDFSSIFLTFDKDGTLDRPTFTWADIRSYHRYTIKRISATLTTMEQTPSNSYDYTSSAYTPTVDLVPCFRVWDSSQPSTLTINNMFVRKYTAVEPTVTIEDMGAWYKVTVTNIGDETLTDYQVAIPSADLNISSNEESLYIAKINSSQHVMISEDFTNNKTINVSPSSDGTLTDYQMNFDIDYEPEMQADFDDLRFTDENDILLPYWIESMTNSSEAKVWVKIPEIDGTNNTILKMYYGNSTVLSAQNGEEVFEFFDEFDNLSQWYQYGSTPLSPDENTVSNGILTTAMQRGEGQVRQLRTIEPLPVDNNYSIHTRLFTMKETAYDCERLFITPKESAVKDESVCKMSVYTGVDRLYYNYNSGVYSSIPLDTNCWYRSTITYTDSTGSISLYNDSTGVLIGSNSGTIANEGDYLFLTGAHSYGKYDYVFVTKHVENEPIYVMTEESAVPYWIESNDTSTWMKIDELAPFETQVYAVQKENGYAPNGSEMFVQYHGPSTSSYLDSLLVNPSNVIYESKVKVNGDANIWFGLADTQADSLSNGLTIKPNPQTATYSRNYAFAWKTGNPTVLYTAVGVGSTVADTYYNLKIECNGSSAKYYIDDTQLLSTITTNIPTANLGLGANIYSGSFTQDWAFARKYAAVEPGVTVQDMGSWYKVTVINNAGDTLTDYQIAVPSTGLNISSTEESLYIAKMNSSQPAMISESEFTNNKTITISPSSDGTLIDYQMSFDIEHEPEMQPDFDDIRFTDENGILIPYWIKSMTNSSKAKVWVKVPEINATSGATVKMYYGNSGVGPRSDGYEVFDFFDDFENIGLNNHGNWSLEKTGSFNIAQYIAVVLDATDDNTNVMDVFTQQSGEWAGWYYTWARKDLSLPAGDYVVECDSRTLRTDSTYWKTSIQVNGVSKYLGAPSSTGWLHYSYSILDSPITSLRLGQYTQQYTATASVRYDDVIVSKYTANKPAYTILDSDFDSTIFSDNKTISISASSDGILTDYQMSFNIDYEDEMQPDFDDIRFTDEDGIILPYWIESMTNSSEAKVWVKIPVIDGTNDTVIKMHYGNPTVSSAENGDEVFEFFDDFSSALDTNKWTTAYNTPDGGSYDVVTEDGKLKVSARGPSYAVQADAYAKTKDSFNFESTPLEIEYSADQVISSGEGAWWYSGFIFSNDTTMHPKYCGGHYVPDNGIAIRQPLDGYGSTGAAINVNSYVDSSSTSIYHTTDNPGSHKFNLIMDKENVTLYVDDVMVAENVEHNLVDYDSYIYFLRSSDQYIWNTQKWDYVIVRQHAFNEPTYSISETIDEASFSDDKIITISPSSDGTLTDYQMSFNITYEPEMQTDFDDLRFTDEYSILIPYWIESMTNSSSAKVWVKVPEIDATSGVTIKMYYGNSTVESESNGDEVFEFFDDFSSSLDIDKWTTAYNTPDGGSYDVGTEDGKLKVSARGPSYAVQADAYAKTKDSFNFESTLLEIEYSADQVISSGEGAWWYSGFIFSNDTTMPHKYCGGHYVPDNGIAIRQPLDGYGSTGAAINVNSYVDSSSTSIYHTTDNPGSHKFNLIMDKENVTLYVDDVMVAENVEHNLVDYDSYIYFLRSSDQFIWNTQKWDYVIVRQHAFNEPTYSILENM
ncbi:DUF2341 domain-containing protein [uncultured Methanolobus sp.]|uniref:DUF2341 domain-containing protein n=1 Tax=uncultured Methanolobus sp. TaxID=218300 RepID=UPI002AAC256E|nr:DUF2341 domain-containing protein [uncultured Methanolobus sp.]